MFKRSGARDLSVEWRRPLCFEERAPLINLSRSDPRHPHWRLAKRCGRAAESDPATVPQIDTLVERSLRSEPCLNVITDHRRDQFSRGILLELGSQDTSRHRDTVEQAPLGRILTEVSIEDAQRAACGRQIVRQARQGGSTIGDQPRLDAILDHSRQIFRYLAHAFHPLVEVGH